MSILKKKYNYIYQIRILCLFRENKKKLQKNAEYSYSATLYM